MKLMQVKEPQYVLELIGREFQPLSAVLIGLEEAGGHCLAEKIIVAEDLPGFNRSTVDGYALAAKDSFGASEGMPAMLELIGEVLMGREAPSIKNGQCCLVHTGGMLPEEADAVIMLEDTETTGSMVQCFRQVAPGENVIRRGEDLTRGDTALEMGHFLRAPDIGLLASIGRAEVTVYRLPVVGFFSSGDELVDYRNSPALPAGKIRESNAPALLYLGRQYGAVCHYGGILPDHFDIFLEKSRVLLETCDMLVFSGGSSVGSRDFTARTMQELGKPGLLVEGIAIQPGKPTLLANCNGKPVLGLPGHPVSALNIFSLFGRVLIERLSGKKSRVYQPTVKATLARNISSRTGRTDFVRVRLEKSEKGWSAVPIPGRSGLLRTMVEADGLLTIAAEKEGLSSGETVEITILE